MLVPMPEFPASRADLPHVLAGLAKDGLLLRPAAHGDMTFLRHLYGETRAAELAAMPWPAAVRTQFLDSQFALQHRHYVSHFADADFLVLEQDGAAVGRLYLQRSAPEFLIVEISLLKRAQGRGIGGRLITAVQQLAAAMGCGVQLHVDRRNLRAQRLYRRLGFAVSSQDDTATHLPMRWHADAAATLS